MDESEQSQGFAPPYGDQESHSTTEQPPADAPEPGEGEPDNENGVEPADPIVGDQGDLSAAIPSEGTGVNDVDTPVRTSALPPEAQSGLPALPENEGVEPQADEDEESDGGEE